MEPSFIINHPPNHGIDGNTSVTIGIHLRFLLADRNYDAKFHIVGDILVPENVVDSCSEGWYEGGICICEMLCTNPKGVSGFVVLQVVYVLLNPYGLEDLN